MHALYAFMRQTDDLGDNPQPPEVRRQWLVRWRAMLGDALEGRFVVLRKGKRSYTLVKLVG